MSKHKVEGVLSRYRVLDLTDEKGSFCGKILGDLGADVIKIENPGGDSSRRLGPFYHDELNPEKSLLWWAFNTSKRGITLDIEMTEGKDIFWELIKKADLLTESFPPGYMTKIGLGYETLSKVNPGIIMVSISGFGQDGPYADYKAPDIVCMAMSGYMNLIGDPDRAPLRITVPQAYLHASSEGVAGALIALWHREMTGKGQWVDVSAQESVALATFDNQIYWSMSQINLNRLGSQRELNNIPVPLIFPCKDGYVVCLMPGGVTRTKTQRLVEWMAEEGKASDLLKGVDWEMFAGDAQPPEETLEIVRNFGPFFLTKTKQELFDQAISRGFFLAPVNSIQDTFDYVQLKERGFWQGIKHPELNDEFVYPVAPFKTLDHIYQIRKRAPLIGEHNDEIFGGELGFSKEQINSLSRKRVI